MGMIEAECGGYDKKPPVHVDMGPGGIKNTATLREFSTGAHRNDNSGKGDYSLIPSLFEHELSIHYQGGAIAKGRNNWKKGIPSSALYDSARRHLGQYMRGDRSENHLVAVVWNIIGLWYNERKHKNNPEIYDIKEFD